MFSQAMVVRMAHFMHTYIHTYYRTHVRKRRNCEFKQNSSAFLPVQGNLAFNGTAPWQIGSEVFLFSESSCPHNASGSLGVERNDLQKEYELS